MSPRVERWMHVVNAFRVIDSRPNLRICMVTKFSCTIEHARILVWCGVESRISYSSFTPRGGIKYKVFDISLLLFFASICIAVNRCIVSHCTASSHTVDTVAQASDSIDRAPACRVDESRKKRVTSILQHRVVADLSSSCTCLSIALQHDLSKCQASASRDEAWSKGVEQRTPKQTRSTTGRYLTW